MLKRPPPLSLLIYYICCVFLLGSTFLVNKFNEQNSRTIISWDIAGYYLYLPAFFYDNPGKINNLESIKEKYSPFGDGFYQALKQPNGNYVIKYPYGQALMFFPAFAVGHLCAKLTGYPVDGFSLPYQISFTIGCVFFSFLGLWFIRRALLKYYTDKIVALSLFVLCFATNYYNYVSFSGGLPHSNLFTVYALIIYFTILFYEKPTFALASALGFLSGLAVITRPTEIVCVFIPVFWGVSDWDSFKIRIQTFIKQYRKLAAYIFFAALMCFIQLLYWKKYSGHFIQWSYGEDERFDFFHPHFIAGLFSCRKGWFMYTPVMILSILGFIPLFKKNRNIFWTASIFTLVNLYFVFAWSRWWYGGSFSQRAVIESYAVLLFPLASFFTWAFNKIISAIALSLFILFCIWFNLLMTY